MPPIGAASFGLKRAKAIANSARTVAVLLKDADTCQVRDAMIAIAEINSARRRLAVKVPDLPGFPK